MRLILKNLRRSIPLTLQSPNAIDATIGHEREISRQKQVEIEQKQVEIEQKQVEIEQKQVEIEHQRYLHLAEIAYQRDMYIVLMQRCVLNTIYMDKPLYNWMGRSDKEAREYGYDWPSVAHSMIGIKRMSNLRYLTECIIRDNVPGDLIETGVWRGGACIFMRAILKAYNDKTRKVWVADSFQGLPVPNINIYPADTDADFSGYKELAVSLEEVKSNFESYDLLDEQVMFLKGWFSETLPTAPIEKLAMLRLDGDMYESTMDGLKNLYHKVSIGGYVIVDDYHVVGACKLAVDEFRNSKYISDPIHEIDGVGVYWQKSEQLNK